MADFVRASHPVFGTMRIPTAWLTTYPGAWTELEPEDPGSGPDPLSMYVRDVDLPAQMAAHVGDGSAFDLAQRAAFASADRVALDPREFADGIGTEAVDNSPGLQLWLDELLATGRPGHLPKGRFRLDSPVAYSGAGARSGPQISGAGMWDTVLVPDFTGAAAFRVDRPGSPHQFFYGGHLRDFGIESESSDVDGISVAGWWLYDIEAVRVDELAGDAIAFPLRPDLSANPDDYASVLGAIRRCYLVNNTGWGINGAAGLAWGAAEVSHNKINANAQGGVYTSGHSNRIVQNSFASNGQATNNGAIYQIATQATPNGAVIEDNEYDANYGQNVWIVGASGGRVGVSRHISREDGAALRPAVHVRLGASGTVQNVTGLELPSNYHRSEKVGNYPLALYRAEHTSVQAIRITEPQIPTADNTSAVTRFENFTANNEMEAIVGGDVVSAGPTSRHYVGRLRTGPVTLPLAGGFVTVPFDNEQIDPDNDNDVALGFLTPHQTVYDLNVAVTISGLAVGNTVTLAVAQGGGNFREFEFYAGGLAHETFTLSARHYLVAGVRLTVRARQNSGADKSVRVGDNYNEFSVVAVR